MEGPLEGPLEAPARRSEPNELDGGVQRPAEPDAASKDGSVRAADIFEDDTDGFGEEEAELDPDQYVILRMEFISHKELKVSVAFGFVWSTVGLAIMLAFIIALSRIKNNPNVLLRNDNYMIANVVISSVFVFLLTLMLGRYGLNLRRSRLAHKKWTPRRLKICQINCLQLAAVLLSAVVVLIPNAVVLGTDCTWFGHVSAACDFVRSTSFNIVLLIFLINTHNTCEWIPSVTPLSSKFFATTPPNGASNGASPPRKQQSGVNAVGGPVTRQLTVLDAPWSIHAPKLILFALTQGFIITSLVSVLIDPVGVLVSKSPSGTDCRDYNYTCSQSSLHKAMTILFVVAIVLYFILCHHYIRGGYRAQSNRAYGEDKMQNINLRQQASVVLSNFYLVIVAIILGFAADYTSCSIFILHFLGFLPILVQLSSISILQAYLYFPKDPGSGTPALQVWFQQFCWTEEEKPGAIWRRDRRIKETFKSRASVFNPFGDGDAGSRKEPMLCIETALKLLYWSTFAYRYKDPGLEAEAASITDIDRDDASNAAEGIGKVVEQQAKGVLENVPGVSRTPAEEHAITKEDFAVTEEVAMGLYDLENIKCFWDADTDTKMVMGWNSRTIVMSFRGTASLTNAWVDLQAWRTTHHPSRGSWWLGTQPLVHHGFNSCWQKNSLNETVLNFIRGTVFSTPGCVEAEMRVLLTGHSLGGALALLAGLEVQQQLNVKQVEVYTFGAPRPGNHALAKEISQLVPETWQIIDDKDTVPTTPKFVTLYKRPGQRVVITATGDIIVRPNFLELRMLNLGGSVKDHFLAQHRAAFAAICKAQFGDKRLQGGRAGVCRLAAAVNLRSVLLEAGFDVDQATRQLVVDDVEKGKSDESGRNCGNMCGCLG